MNRRRMMMESRSKTKYPFINGNFKFTSQNTQIIVSNGNHVKINNMYGVTSFINLSNIFQNTGNIESQDNVTQKPKLFTLNQGDICELKILNLTRILTNGTFIFAFNFKEANGSSSLEFGTGNTTDLSDKIVNVTVQNTEDIGCLFMYAVVTTQITTFEFDVEFYVNGERWI